MAFDVIAVRFVVANHQLGFGRIIERSGAACRKNGHFEPSLPRRVNLSLDKALHLQRKRALDSDGIFAIFELSCVAGGAGQSHDRVLCVADRIVEIFLSREAYW